MQCNQARCDGFGFSARQISEAVIAGQLRIKREKMEMGFCKSKRDRVAHIIRVCRQKIRTEFIVCALILQSNHII